MSNFSGLELHFSKIGGLSLQKTVFSIPHLHKPIVGFRYSSSSLPAGFSCFRWTTGMIAISLLFIRAKLFALKGDEASPVLEGPAGSVARSANVVLSKPRMWLFDLFGYDAQGRPLLRRLVSISNSNFRWGPMPVRIFFKRNIFSPTNIRIFLDGLELSTTFDIDALSENLESQYLLKSKSPATKAFVGSNSKINQLAA